MGDAVVKRRGMVIDGTYPGIKTQAELFTDPIGHAGPQVQAVASYCNFVAIYRDSPEGLKLPGTTITETQHAILRKLAWETVSAYPYAGIAKKQTGNDRQSGRCAFSEFPPSHQRLGGRV